MSITVNRLPLQLKPDPERVISRLFCPGDVKRSRDIFARVEAFPEDEVERLVADLERDFRRNHFDVLKVFAEHYEEIQNDRGASSGQPCPDAALGRLFHHGLLARIGRAFQSFDRSGDLSGRRSGGFDSISDESARHR